MKAKLRARALPQNLPPLGLNRDEAAAYIGVSVTKFDEMVADGRMPKSKPVDRLRLWSRPMLDKFFHAMPDEEGESDSPWDDVAA